MSMSLRAVSLACLLLAAVWLAPAHASDPKARDGAEAASWGGWLQADYARVVEDPTHTANARLRLEIAGKGKWSGNLKWKLSARGDYDAAYDRSDFYLPGVRRDLRADVTLREAYVDWNRGDWEWRIGRQHIVWGEMVGLFFADVVSAKDLRQFVLPEFEQIRIPQWAVRAEHFSNARHLEFIWLPAPAYDDIGKPGSDFYPWPFRYPGLSYQIGDEQKLPRTVRNGGFGARISQESGGWDWSGFAYNAPDTSAAFNRQLVGFPGSAIAPAPGVAPGVIWTPGYGKVTRLGGTAARDFSGVVLKAEAVLTLGRRFSVPDLSVAGGVIRQNTLDWVVGLEATPLDGLRLNGQLYQRVYLNHDPALGVKRFETGVSLMGTYALTPTLDAEVLGITSLVREDWLLRTALIWKAGPQLRVRAGYDAFGGVPLGLFGRYWRQDRVYAQARYSF